VSQILGPPHTFFPWSKDNKLSYQSDYYKITRPFKEFFGKMSFKQITPMVIERYKRERLAKPIEQGKGDGIKLLERKPASVNRELQLLSKIFNLAIRDRITQDNPCQHVKKLRENNRRTRYLTSEEEEALLNQLTGPRAHLRPIVLLAIYTGMRKGEIFNLQWSDIDFQRGFLRVAKSKTGRDRWLPMNQLVSDALDELKEKADKDVPLMFPSLKTGGRIIDIKKGFAKACREAGIINLHFHDLRHTTATRLGEDGVDLSTIAEFLGHTDLRMTARYTHATDRNLRAAAESLADHKSRKEGKNVTRMSQRRKSG
jgi:integrase